MDKNAIKKYAVWARRELISRVSQRAALYEITDKGYGDASADSVLGRVMSAEEKRQRQALIAQIQEKGYEQVMEEIAYTWFNRFIALRFMEVNGYLPSRVRVFTDEENTFKPQILTEAINMELDGLDMEKVYALKNANDDDALFKYMIIVQCNALSSILPGMFQHISDFTELLFPDNLLREGSVIEQMVTMIAEEDWTDQVQIIGWLYQYYNTEPKDKVFADLKKNIKISKENIPAATQLFTPDWIVRYMVENSLGRLWLEGHPNDELKASWKYYLDEAEQEPEVQVQLSEIQKEYATLKPEDILAIDPCQGSGHILAYMFDVLIQIYEAYGYTAREAASSIVAHNIWGLDIDGRAAQLAYFSVMMKARQYDRRFFSRGIQPHVYAIVESNGLDPYCIEYFVNDKPELKMAMDILVRELHDAKEYGSILSVTQVDFPALFNRFEEIKNESNPNVYSYQVLETVLPFVELAKAMAQKYSVVITNPPYMGSGNMAATLSEYVKVNYPDSKNDMSTVFMEKTISMCDTNGLMAMINIPVWMFLSSYERLRKKIFNCNTILNMVHPGRGIFGSDFGTTSFVISKTRIKRFIAVYRRLFEKQGDVETPEVREMAFLSGKGESRVAQESYSKLPGAPIAYWVGEKFLDSFGKETIGTSYFSGGRNKTHNNEKYLRVWWEISDRVKWQPYDKGGDFRRWYGNYNYVVDWSDSAKNDYASHGGLYNQMFAGKEGISWTNITAAKTSFRVKEPSHHYDSCSSVIYNDRFELDLYVLGLLNSNIASFCFDVLNPTIHVQPRDVMNLPFIDDKGKRPIIEKLVRECIDISIHDWDSSELSIDFKRHPLVPILVNGRKVRLSELFTKWTQECDIAYQRIKRNEETLNKLFLEIYGLGDEVSSEVRDKDISLLRPNLESSIKSLISYAVGCMFGRYSLDWTGIAYEGGVWEENRYITFQPDLDGILPICDDEYFSDDIVGRFVDFIKCVYGDSTLEENLLFIAKALGGKGSPRDVLRSYFLDEFYLDHCNTYSVTGSGKRPIYWLFDSGKKNGFKCLIYMHRYQPDTIARIRTDYVHEQQSRYRTAIADLESRIANAGTGERVKLSKQLTKLQEQAEELRVYEEKIHHLADQMIRIDLDDGVKHNYAIFQDVLAKIK